MMTRTIVCLGDSILFSAGSGVRCDEYSPAVLERLLQGDGFDAMVRNCGKSGDTTTQTLARIADAVYCERPDVVVIFSGYNDQGASIPQATTQSNIQAMIRHLRNGCMGQVSGQASLPPECIEGTRYLVISDTSTTGGVAPILTGTQSGPQVWESRNGLAGESGWGRIDSGDGEAVSKFLVLTTHFCNYGTGGDSLDADGGHDGQNATRKQVYEAQLAAATAEKVTFCDLYAFLQSRIATGQTGDTATNRTWHSADGDIHPNAYGQDLIGKCIHKTILSQPDLVAMLNER